MSNSLIVSKSRAALESAGRTFLQAALPALVASVSLSPDPGVTFKDAVVAALMSAGAAGLAAVMRVYKPLQTDAQGKGVEGVPLAPRS